MSREDALVPVIEGLQSKEEASYVAAAGKDTHTARYSVMVMMMMMLRIMYIA